jgi:hypothetical protein
MSASVTFTSGTVFTVPSNFLNNSTALLWIWYSGGGGGGGRNGASGRGGNGGNLYLIDPINLSIGGQYGVTIGASAGQGAGTNASSFYVWPQSGFNGANAGGAGGATSGGGGGAANPGGGGGNGGTTTAGAAGAGSSPWPSFGGAGGSGGAAVNQSGQNGNAYGGGGGGGDFCTVGVLSSGGFGLQGIVYLFYNTVTPATISSASPSSTAYQNNGVGVTLGGTMFNTVSSVLIQDTTSGALYNCGFIIESDSVLFIVPPAVPQRAAYNPNIYITNQAGQAVFSNIYTLFPNIPICSSVTGPSYDNGTNQVNLNGQFFTTLSTVEIQGVGALTHVTAGTPGPGVWWFGNDSVIGMFLPVITPQAPVNVILQVFNSSGSDTLQVEYIPSPPTFATISATTGDESGGYNVTITGTSFTTTQQVFFGSAVCPNFVVNSDTSITVTVPSFNGVSQFAGGVVNVTLGNLTAAVSGFQFTYTFSGYPALNAAHAFA